MLQIFNDQLDEKLLNKLMRTLFRDFLYNFLLGTRLIDDGHEIPCKPQWKIIQRLIKQLLDQEGVCVDELIAVINEYFLLQFELFANWLLFIDIIKVAANNCIDLNQRINFLLKCTSLDQFEIPLEVLSHFGFWFKFLFEWFIWLDFFLFFMHLPIGPLSR